VETTEYCAIFRRKDLKLGLLFLTERHESRLDQTCCVFIVVSCLRLLSRIELCIFLCRLVLFVSQVIGWEDLLS